MSTLQDFLFVVDSGNHRIVRRLCSDLSYVDSYGTMGSGNNQLQNPSRILFSGDYIYISDSGNHRLLKLNAANWEFVSKVGNLGSGNDQFNRPQAVTIHGEFLYVMDQMNGRIVKRRVDDLSYEAKIGTLGYNAGQDIFCQAAGITNNDEKLYVIDSWNNHWETRDFDLNWLNQSAGYYGRGGHGTDEYENPQAIHLYPPYYYISDLGNGRIVQRLSSDFSYVRAVGLGYFYGWGSGNDQFNNPMGLCSDGTYLYVADAGNHRIVKRLASDMTYVSKLGTQGSGVDQFYGPSDVAVQRRAIFALSPNFASVIT